MSIEVIKVYAAQRPTSYGSYFRTYYSLYGSDMTDWRSNMDKGIASGWQPDAGCLLPLERYAGIIAPPLVPIRS
jgi:hypothetical protein